MANASPDPKLIGQIAEGHTAAMLLDAFGATLDALVENSLKGADELIENHRLTPELSLAVLHEVGAYRRIKNRLRQKATRGQHAALTVRQNGDTGDHEPSVN